MNYTTNKLIQEIEKRKNRRKKAVFLAGRIKKSNQSPGFDWKKAMEGFKNQFTAESFTARDKVRQEHPEHPEDNIEWILLIIYFADQPYKREKTNA